MARLPRLNLINIPQHIVQVGHNSLPCFFCDDDYAFYLQSLRAASDQYKVDVHAYVLLPSMIQIIATPNIPNGISSMMQSLGRRYVQYINHRYKRSGTLWGGRYKSSVIDSTAYLLTCYRYVELRPLHMGLVDDVEDYRWSSFPHHIGLCNDSLIIDHPLFLELGDSRKQRCYAYQQLFKYEFGVAVMDYIAETVSVGQILGGDGFKDQIEKIANVRVRPLKRGRPKKSSAAR
ncbi:hypothetical protein SIN8267_00217 [Sinobacterium norvegicum]|uniref:Transposase IS200-like domain-containing protein n=1 Tax=Sinobacterium norvegicum TaxID=1641715 RepID=A0ABN8EFN5_9GAMM|nr:transposase [Sinobacterium norvegicum]CAH0990132.1 hypothetical protein SIN8267_00217 [Sinobacterium norvegicum]